MKTQTRADGDSNRLTRGEPGKRRIMAITKFCTFVVDKVGIVVHNHDCAAPVQKSKQTRETREIEKREKARERKKKEEIDGDKTRRSDAQERRAEAVNVRSRLRFSDDGKRKEERNRGRRRERKCREITNGEQR